MKDRQGSAPSSGSSGAPPEKHGPFIAPLGQEGVGPPGLARVHLTGLLVLLNPKD